MGAPSCGRLRGRPGADIAGRRGCAPKAADVLGQFRRPHRRRPGPLPLAPQPGDNGSTGNYLLAAAEITDPFFACQTRSYAAGIAAHTTVFQYEFAHRDGPGLGAKYPGYVWGAGHAAELPYPWPSFDNGLPIAATFDAGERKLARDMVSTGPPSWPPDGRAGRACRGGRR